MNLLTKLMYECGDDYIIYGDVIKIIAPHVVIRPFRFGSPANTNINFTDEDLKSFDELDLTVTVGLTNMKKEDFLKKFDALEVAKSGTYGLGYRDGNFSVVYINVEIVEQVKLVENQVYWACYGEQTYGLFKPSKKETSYELINEEDIRKLTGDIDPLTKLNNSLAQIEEKKKELFKLKNEIEDSISGLDKEMQQINRDIRKLKIKLLPDVLYTICRKMYREDNNSFPPFRRVGIFTSVEEAKKYIPELTKMYFCDFKLHLSYEIESYSFEEMKKVLTETECAKLSLGEEYINDSDVMLDDIDKTPQPDFCYCELCVGK